MNYNKIDIIISVFHNRYFVNNGQYITDRHFRYIFTTNIKLYGPDYIKRNFYGYKL